MSPDRSASVSATAADGPAPGQPPNPGRTDGFENGETSDSLTIIVERRVLVRDCLVNSLTAAGLKGEVRGYASLADVADRGSLPPYTAVLTAAHSLDHPATSDDRWSEVVERSAMPPFMLMLADDVDPSLINAALDGGYRAYIPTTLPLGVVVEIVNLVRAGGIFAPPTSRSIEAPPLQSPGPDRRATFLTSRQNAVIDALRQGKSNKAIAYALDMRESTVKVHVRNVMRKLKARNRTEVAFLMNRLETPTSDAPAARPPLRSFGAARPWIQA